MPHKHNMPQFHTATKTFKNCTAFKGSLPSQKWMNFRKKFQTAFDPHIFGKSYCIFLGTLWRLRVKYILNLKEILQYSFLDRKLPFLELSRKVPILY